MPSTSNVSMQRGRFSRSFADSQVSNDHHFGCFDPLSTIEMPQTPNDSSSISSYLPVFLSTTASLHENTTSQQRLPVSYTELNFHQELVPNERKRTLTVGGGINNNSAAEKDVKRKKAVCLEYPQHRNYQTPEELLRSDTQQQLPAVRRTQKLGDRVTALQKLVSPFGKTDTASVLQEASVYIKLLHEQIYTLTIPYFSAGPLLPQGFEEKKGDLRSKGLCLVPVSFTQNLNKEGSVGQSISRRTCLHFP